jgi:xanthine dehydrogenase accessory factor
MFDIAAQVAAWRVQGRTVAVARTVSVTGVSSRWPVEALALTAGQPTAGTLLAGTLDGQLAQVAAELWDQTGAARVVTLDITDRTATEAGLACGGTARILVQPADDVPLAAWALLDAREPLCLVTDLSGPRSGHTTFFSTATSPDELAASRHSRDLVTFFGRGASDSDVRDVDATQVLVAALWPRPRLIIVGDGLLAAALARQADVLGWTPQTVDEVDPGRQAVSGLTRTDGVIVLTHDASVDAPVLAAALAGGAGYIGALGSRRTQASRAQWLRDAGVDEADIAGIRGPAGLDIGSRTPAEIALAVAAEMLATRNTASGAALRDVPGPVHRDGLNTPPARYSTA